MKNTIILLTVILLAYCSGGQDKTPVPNPDQKVDTHEHEGAAHTHEHEGETSIPEKATHEHESEGETAAQHEHDEIEVPQDKQKAWGIKLAKAGEQTLASRISLPGILTLNQNRTAHITSFIHGQIAYISTDLGAKVKKGQSLLTLNSPEFAQIQADFLRALAKLNLSRKEYDRAKMLLEEKAIEEKEFLRREAEYQQLSTEYGALGSRLHSLGVTHTQIEELINKCQSMEDAEYKCEIADPLLPILSPISGTIIFRDAIAGEHIEPEKILFTASDISKLWAILDAYEKDLPYISLNSSVVITSSLFPGEEFAGKITYISDQIDEKLRTVKVRVEIDNSAGRLKPNMYIEGIIENKAEKSALIAIPESAIQNLEGEKVVFIPEGNNIFAVRHISLGNKIGNLRIILSGLANGEDFVMQGAFALKTEMSKAAFGHAHVH